MVQITVVMAVYNAEAYLQRSVDSLLRQSNKNWKLICVDDGSTDKSLAILRDFEKKDPRITVLMQENQGPAAAREKAYLATETSHAMILDADDEYSSDMLENVYSLLTYDVDCIIPNAMIEYSDGNYVNWFEAYGLKHGQQISSEEAFERSLLSPSVHGWCLYKTELLKQNAVGGNARYNRFNEDEYIQRVLLLNSKKILFSEGKYIYHHNDSSITKGFRLKHLGYLTTCKKIIELAKDQHLSERLQDLTYEYLFRTLVQLRVRQIHTAGGLSKAEHKEVSARLKEYFILCRNNREKIHYVDKTHPSLFKFVVLNNFYLLTLVCWCSSIRKN